MKNIPQVDKENKCFLIELNSIHAWGSISKNPSIIYQLKVDGTLYDERLGDSSFSGDALDYIVHRVKGVTLWEQEKYYKEHDVQVIVIYVGSDSKVRTATFKAISNNNWNKISPEKVV